MVFPAMDLIVPTGRVAGFGATCWVCGRASATTAFAAPSSTHTNTTISLKRPGRTFSHISIDDSCNLTRYANFDRVRLAGNAADAPYPLRQGLDAPDTPKCFKKVVF